LKKGDSKGERQLKNNSSRNISLFLFSFYGNEGGGFREGGKKKLRI
jgi:hypothetical protein